MTTKTTTYSISYRRYGVDQNQWRSARRARLGGYGDRPTQWQHHLPLALLGLHRHLHAPLPHDEPRRARHDAGRRSLRRVLTLSADAIAVVKHLIDRGVDPRHLVAAGF